MVRLGSPIDSSSAICSAASRDASCVRPDTRNSIAGPVMLTASDALSPDSAGDNSRSSAKVPERRWARTLRGADAQHGAGRDAHRGTVWVVVGQRVGDPAGPLPTHPRRGDVTVDRPCAGAHVPGVRGMQVAGGVGDVRR